MALNTLLCPPIACPRSLAAVEDSDSRPQRQEHMFLNPNVPVGFTFGYYSEFI